MTTQRLSEAFSLSELKQGREAAQELLQGEMGVYDGSHHPYADLAVWLGFLRALGMIHHSHHWQTMGSPFYGDHLLLERLYKAVQDEVDTVGEKVVGIDSPALTNYFLQMNHMRGFMKKVSSKDKPPMVVSLESEFVFIATGELISDRLREAGLFTSGLANMMGDILDRHENHVYLLKQRLALMT
jgi:DNA-binding ferritin-like protein